MTSSTLSSNWKILPGVLLLWPLVTLGAAPQMPSPQDAQVEQLKVEVTAIERRARDAIESLQYPAYSRVGTYLGIPLGNVLVRSVDVRIDGLPARNHAYDPATAFALIQNGLAPLDTLSVAPGSHTLTVRLTYVQGNDKKDAQDDANPAQDKPVVQTLEQTFNFTKTDLAAQLVIDVYQPRLFATPALRLTQWEPKP